VHFVDVSEEHKRPRGPLGADVLHAEDGGIWSSNDQREALRAIYYWCPLPPASNALPSCP
jgi:hypothetical protein